MMDFYVYSGTSFELFIIIPKFITNVFGMCSIFSQSYSRIFTNIYNLFIFQKIFNKYFKIIQWVPTVCNLRLGALGLRPGAMGLGPGAWDLGLGAWGLGPRLH